jgi:hypothetical protein
MMFTLLVAVLAAWLFAQGGTAQRLLGWLVLMLGGALGEYWWPCCGLVLVRMGVSAAAVSRLDLLGS